MKLQGSEVGTSLFLVANFNHEDTKKLSSYVHHNSTLEYFQAVRTIPHPKC